MAKLGKRTTAARAKVDPTKVYKVADAVKLVKGNATAKFNETIEIAINLGVVTKIHRRTAIVAHVSKGGTGLMMESLTGTR